MNIDKLMITFDIFYIMSRLSRFGSVPDLRKIGAKFIKVFNDVDSSEFMEASLRMHGNLHPRYHNTRFLPLLIFLLIFLQ